MYCRVAMARTPQDETMTALALKATGDPNYQAIYRALVATKRPHDLPRNHPAQSVGAAWTNLSVEAEMPSLFLYMCHI